MLQKLHLLLALFLFLSPGLYVPALAQEKTVVVQPAQTDPLERCLWYDEAKTAKIKIYKAVDGKYYGKVIWLKIPDRDGKPKVDMHNDPILGMLILKGLKKTDENIYDHGTIYDPTNGKTYSCKITVNGDSLQLHGYIGFSFIGHSTTWTKAE
jgi:uncharacterized protein (DUF2147 family)